MPPRIFRGRDVAAGPVETLGVPPVDPRGRGQLDLIGRAPGTLPVDELRLVEAVDGLGEDVVVRAPRDPAPTLLALQGCGPLTAAKIVGEVADIGRFRSATAFARHDGTAPVPVWSGNEIRHRLNRGGNRQINVALHRIAITQLQRPGNGQDDLAKRMTGGDTKTEAIRLLRRRISDEVYRRMRLDAASLGWQPGALGDVRLT